jgi:hypothetical protein
MKNKECRTSKLNILFDLTSSFSKTYDTKKEKTQTQKVLWSHLVDNSIEISNLSFTPRELIDTHHIMTLIVKSST